MKYFSLLILLPALLLACSPGVKSRGERQVLIFTSDKVLNDEAQQQEILTLKAYFEAESVKAIASSQEAYLQEDSLCAYSSLVFFKLNYEQIDYRQQADIERYLQSGGGLMSLNSQLSQKYHWPWMDSLLVSHRGLPENSITKVADVEKITAVEGFYTGLYDGGRIAVRSDADEFNEASMPQLVRYLVGENTYSLNNVHSLPAPKESRFSRIILDDQDVNEPMELTVLPDGRVLFIERRGKMKLYKPDLDQTLTIANFDVCLEGNYEDGLLGLAADPNFAENGFIYLYYSPPCNTWEQYLSRFMLRRDSIILASEKVLLKVPVQRETCCHSGGSVRFDAKGNLWLSTGDNTSSKESNGYTPIDTRDGRGPYDAQKSSSNTHDLRGKILRIRPNDWGTYDIPKGNLFPKDGSEGRPEIYIMGARNPFRIAVDDKTGFVYWGDVGPDAGQDSKYGRASTDEFNQARTPGFFGWPYFMGNNIAFPFRDFSTDTVGELFNPAQPVNNSPNNTGNRELPPAQPAFMWYGKSVSKEFPVLGRGSNSALAGPIYYAPASAEESSVKLPEYYEGKWFIYEWARSWIKVVTMNEAGDLVKIEPFLSEVDWVKPIEMEVGPDGALYVLEYGENYFMNNPSARLSRIEYAAGNRLPVPRLEASKTVGGIPLLVSFSAQNSFDNDEGDVLRYEWFFTDTTEVQAEGENTEFTFTEVGVYPVKLRVWDNQGGYADSRINIQAGNEPPEIQLQLSGNQSFYFGKESREYRVVVSDQEDDASGKLNPANLKINFVYVPDGEDLEVMLGEKRTIDASFRFAKGLNLIKNSDCKSCHAETLKSVGPSYFQIAEHYMGRVEAVEKLARKIIIGGNGVWGEKIMAGHPQHSMEETREMVRYILALADKTDASLPVQGNLVFSQHLPEEARGAYLLASSYTDLGANNLPPASTREMLILRAPVLIGDMHDESFQIGRRVENIQKGRENIVVSGIRNGSWLAFHKIDLSRVSAFDMRLQSFAGGTIELRSGSVDGPLIGSLELQAGKEGEGYRTVSMALGATNGEQDLYLLFINENPEARNLFNFDRIWVIPQTGL